MVLAPPPHNVNMKWRLCKLCVVLQKSLYNYKAEAFINVKTKNTNSVLVIYKFATDNIHCLLCINVTTCEPKA